MFHETLFQPETVSRETSIFVKTPHGKEKMVTQNRYNP